MSQLYRIHEFAQRTGVTLKALRHYDRLGLLKPKRTDAGYRVYGERDRQRLEQIGALKLLGIPLKPIKAMLERPIDELPEALRRQRTVLEAKQRQLSRTLEVLQDAETALDAGSSVWKRIIEVVTMQTDVEGMKKYYTDEAWTKRREHYEQWPSPAWQNLYREIGAAFGEDPAGERAQALKARWIKLLNEGATGDPAVQAGAIKAWTDREHWPASLRARIEEFQIEKVLDFLAHAMAANWKKFIASEAWTKMDERQRNPTEPWNEHFRRTRVALEEDPPGKNAQALVLRMMEL